MFDTLFLVLASCCMVDYGISKTAEEIRPNTIDGNNLPDRIQRGFIITGKDLYRVKQIIETILSNAETIKLADGAQLKQYGASLTKYEKYGGQKQAYRDFNLFRAQERQDFILPGGGEGKWAMVGDTTILLENSKDWTTLMIKQETGTSREHIDKIFYQHL